MGYLLISKQLPTLIRSIYEKTWHSETLVSILHCWHKFYCMTLNNNNFHAVLLDRLGREKFPPIMATHKKKKGFHRSHMPNAHRFALWVPPIFMYPSPHTLAKILKVHNSSPFLFWPSGTCLHICK